MLLCIIQCQYVSDLFSNIFDLVVCSILPFDTFARVLTAFLQSIDGAASAVDDDDGNGDG